MEEEKEVWFERNWWKNKGRLYRYFAMINISFIGLGMFVCFDVVGALQEALMVRFNITSAEFSLMYSVNAWPNIVLSIFGGILIDRVFGIKLAAMLYSAVFAVGHVIFSLGVMLQTFWCALVGRLIMGLGTEFLYICMQIFSIQYFRGKELSMVMCIIMSISRLGSSIVYAIADPLLKEIRSVVSSNHDVGIVVFIVGCFCIITIIGAVTLYFMDPKAEESPADEKNKKQAPTITWRDFVLFPLDFWLIISVQIAFCIIIYAFLPFTQKFFKTNYGMSVDSANAVTSFFSLIGPIVAPLIGIIIDKIGRAVVFSKVGLIIAAISHLMMAFTQWSPYISMFLLALAFYIFNGAVVPMLAFIVPDHKLGTAYGVGLSGINIGYAAAIYIAGVIVDKYSYIGMEIFMLIITVVMGLFSSIALWIQDTRGSGILNMTPSQRQIYLAEQQESADVREPLKI